MVQTNEEQLNLSAFVHLIGHKDLFLPELIDILAAASWLCATLDLVHNEGTLSLYFGSHRRTLVSRYDSVV
jgi:hypothetical protein